MEFYSVLRLCTVFFLQWIPEKKILDNLRRMVFAKNSGALLQMKNLQNRESAVADGWDPTQAPKYAQAIFFQIFSTSTRPCLMFSQKPKF